MHWFLKCYYGYKNWWDELLFFGVIDWIKNNTNVTNLTIEVGDKEWMQQWYQRHQTIIDDIGVVCTFVLKWDSCQLANDCLYFFGWGEVINDQDSYTLPKKPSKKQILLSFLSKFFTRSGWNYYLQYWKIIQKKQFFLLGGIWNPYKLTTKALYTIFLSKAKKIVTRDSTSQQIALSYNKNSVLYHDFSDYILERFRQDGNKERIKFSPNSYILINTQEHSRSKNTIEKIIAFVQWHSNKIPVYFPCDAHSDTKYFTMLQSYIPWLQLYDRTQYSVYETLTLFANATAGIGSRLHFLYPLHSFGKQYTTTTTKDKVAKLLSPTPIHAV